MHYNLEIILFGHLLNPIWKSRLERRKIRGEVTRKAILHYLEPYKDFIRNLKPQQTNSGAEDKERIFSIWLQGENAAPEAVKACWKSVRAKSSKELVILDQETISEWISLPEHITRKWKEGKIRPAHYADICRVALLVEYGGLWLDATDYVENDFPEWLWKSDFFIYLSGSEMFGWYSFIQNCFIRSKSGYFLAYAWLELIYEYWKNEDKAIDYFIHQLLFKMLVENNILAKEQFEAIPKIEQDNTHVLWFRYGDRPYNEDIWKEVTASALFQKIEYKSNLAQSPAENTFAYHLLHQFDDKPKDSSQLTQEDSAHK